MEVAIRVCETLDERGEDYELYYFGGVVPVVGDLIVDRSVKGGLDPRDPMNRSVLEVKARYFHPYAHASPVEKSNKDSVYVTLLVSRRPVSKDEIDLAV